MYFEKENSIVYRKSDQIKMYNMPNIVINTLEP